MNAIIILLILILCALVSPELALNLVTILITVGIFCFIFKLIYLMFKTLIIQLMKLEHDTLLFIACLIWCLFWYFVSVPMFFGSVVGICVWYYKKSK